MRAEVWALVRHDLDGAYFGEAAAQETSPFRPLPDIDQPYIDSILSRLNHLSHFTDYEGCLVAAFFRQKQGGSLSRGSVRCHARPRRRGERWAQLRRRPW